MWRARYHNGLDLDFSRGYIFAHIPMPATDGNRPTGQYRSSFHRYMNYELNFVSYRLKHFFFIFKQAVRGIREVALSYSKLGFFHRARERVRGFMDRLLRPRERHVFSGFTKPEVIPTSNFLLVFLFILQM